jgi:hypothetical protein
MVIVAPIVLEFYLDLPILKIKKETGRKILKYQGFPHREGQTDKKKEPVLEIGIS